MLQNKHSIVTLQSPVRCCFKQQHVQSNSTQAPEYQNTSSNTYLEAYQSAIWPCIFLCPQCQFPKLYLVPAMSSCHPFCHFLASPVLPVELFGDMMRLCSDLLEQSSSKAVPPPRYAPISFKHATLYNNSKISLEVFVVTGSLIFWKTSLSSYTQWIILCLCNAGHIKPATSMGQVGLEGPLFITS